MPSVTGSVMLGFLFVSKMGSAVRILRWTLALPVSAIVFLVARSVLLTVTARLWPTEIPVGAQLATLSVLGATVPYLYLLVGMWISPSRLRACIILTGIHTLFIGHSLSVIDNQNWQQYLWAIIGLATTVAVSIREYRSGGPAFDSFSADEHLTAVWVPEGENPVIWGVQTVAKPFDFYYTEALTGRLRSRIHDWMDREGEEEVSEALKNSWGSGQASGDIGAFEWASIVMEEIYARGRIATVSQKQMVRITLAPGQQEDYENIGFGDLVDSLG